MTDYGSRVCNYGDCIMSVRGFDYYCPEHIRVTGWFQDCRAIQCKEPAKIGKVYCVIHDHDDFRADKETQEEMLDRIGACGMGYPSLGLPCVRPKGHDSPVSDCFAMVEELDGTVRGVYMLQDEKIWVDDPRKFPSELVVKHPIFKRKKAEPRADRRAAIEHTRRKHG